MHPSPRHLTLRVTRLNGAPPATELAHRFSERGGTIGRSPQNDWVLSDPTRTVSAHHATLYLDAGGFQLIDCSSNGVFVNDDDQPLGLERIATLNDGDRLGVGPYELVVEIAPARSAALDPLELLRPGNASPPRPVAADPVAPAAPASWSGLAAPWRAGAGFDDAGVDPLALLGGGGAVPAVPASVLPSTSADHAPVLASPLPLLVPVATELPDDWLDPPSRVVRPSRAAGLACGASAADTPTADTPTPTAQSEMAVQALDLASDALRQALAALEALKLALPAAKTLPVKALETAHGLE